MLWETAERAMVAKRPEKPIAAEWKKRRMSTLELEVVVGHSSRVSCAYFVVAEEAAAADFAEIVASAGFAVAGERDLGGW